MHINACQWSSVLSLLFSSALVHAFSLTTTENLVGQKMLNLEGLYSNHYSNMQFGDSIAGIVVQGSGRRRKHVWYVSLCIYNKIGFHWTQMQILPLSMKLIKVIKQTEALSSQLWNYTKQGDGIGTEDEAMDIASLWDQGLTVLKLCLLGHTTILRYLLSSHGMKDARLSKVPFDNNVTILHIYPTLGHIISRS